MLEKIMIIALISSFVVLLFLKSMKKKIEITTKNKIIYDLINCNFCLSFWICLLISIIFCLIYKEFNYIYYAILATPITRYLI